MDYSIKNELNERKKRLQELKLKRAKNYYNSDESAKKKLKTIQNDVNIRAESKVEENKSSFDTFDEQLILPSEEGNGGTVEVISSDVQERILSEYAQSATKLMLQISQDSESRVISDIKPTFARETEDFRLKLKDNLDILDEKTNSSLQRILRRRIMKEALQEN